MEAKERIKYYEKALRLLEGKKFKGIPAYSPELNWFTNESGVCELISLLVNNFKTFGRCDISQFPEFEIFRPTDEERDEEGQLVFWWKCDNRMARVIALTMCIEMAKGNINVE